MKLSEIQVNFRSVVLEINDGGKYYTQKPYEILVNGQFYGTFEKVIQSVFDLQPHTKYEIKIVYDLVVSDTIEIWTKKEFVTLNVKDFGAKGDGENDDTVFIQTAIAACPIDGRVLVPRGVYKVRSLFFKSNITFELEKYSVISAITDKSLIPMLPGEIKSYSLKEEYQLNSWEGDPLVTFAAVITGINIENVLITGKGSIDGCASYDNWWKTPQVKESVNRPKLVFFSNCKKVVIHGITVKNSPSWTIHPYFSKHLRFIDISVINPMISPNTDGINPESCEDVEIVGTFISVGDDCIAIKSGKIYMGRKYKVPTSHMIVRQSCMQNGHGAVTIGSETAAGVNNLLVQDCLFRNTDRGLRIKTRRGRGEDSILSNIIFRNIDMDHVKTPFVVNCFYFCDPDGKTDYVGSKKPLLVDERTPMIKELVFQDIVCHNCHIAAAYIYGLPEQKISLIEMKNIIFDFALDAQEGIPAMMSGAEITKKMGVFARNVERLILENVKLVGNEGESFLLEDIDSVVML